MTETGIRFAIYARSLASGFDSMTNQRLQRRAAVLFAMCQQPPLLAPRAGRYPPSGPRPPFDRAAGAFLRHGLFPLSDRVAGNSLAWISRPSCSVAGLNPCAVSGGE